MDMPRLFPIGEVAKLFNLSVSSLRHYDNTGLLSPEYTDPETGYRYYGPRQFEALNTIRYLRALDMPLPDIEDFLRNRDVDIIEEKLRRQKRAVIEKQKRLELIERKIDNRLRCLHDAQSSEFDVVTEVKAPSCRIVWMSDDLSPKTFLDMEPSIRRLEGSQAEAVVFLGKVGIGISEKHLNERRFGQYDGIFLLLDDEDSFDGEVTRLRAYTLLRQPHRGARALRKADGLYRRPRPAPRRLLAGDNDDRLRSHRRPGKIRHGDKHSRGVTETAVYIMF